MNSDFVDLLKLLEKWKVEYVIIGGYAVMEYSEPRATKAIDILIACNNDNAKKLVGALKEFGASLSGIDTAFFAEKGKFYKIGRPPNRIDIITSAEGADFSDIYNTRVIKDLRGVKIQFIDKENLIKLKESAGRPQDIADVEKLRKY